MVRLGNLLENLPYDRHAYYGLEAITRNVSAVSSTCLFCRREIYEEVNFMDENNFKIAFSDVDFCLKILEKGYRILYNPYIELFHYKLKNSQDANFDLEKKSELEKDTKIFKEKWKLVLDKSDKYYNINFSRNSGNFDLK